MTLTQLETMIGNINTPGTPNNREFQIDFDSSSNSTLVFDPGQCSTSINPDDLPPPEDGNDYPGDDYYEAGECDSYVPTGNAYIKNGDFGNKTSCPWKLVIEDGAVISDGLADGVALAGAYKVASVAGDGSNNRVGSIVLDSGTGTIVLKQEGISIPGGSWRLKMKVKAIRGEHISKDGEKHFIGNVENPSTAVVRLLNGTNPIVSKNVNLNFGTWKNVELDFSLGSGIGSGVVEIRVKRSSYKAVIHIDNVVVVPN